MKSVEIRSETRGGVCMSSVTLCHRMLQRVKAYRHSRGNWKNLRDRNPFRVTKYLETPSRSASS